MKKIILQLEDIKREIATGENYSAPALLKQAALAYSLISVFYSHNSLAGFGPGEFQKKSLSKFEALIHDSDLIIENRGIDFLRAEFATILSLLLVMVETDAESVEDSDLGMTA